MSQPDRNAARGRVLGRTTRTSLGDEAEQEVRQFARCADIAEMNDLLLRLVRENVGGMQQLLADADSFDVIELMRLREAPPVPDLALSIGHGGSAAAMELVALILLCRTSRKPDPTPREQTRPHEAIPELHERATRLLRCGLFKLQAEAALRSEDPLARLASEYQSSLVQIRSMQYASIQDAFNEALFANATMATILKATIGFTYDDLISVRHAIDRIYSDAFIRARDSLGEVAAEWDGGRCSQSPERIAQGRKAFLDLLFLPGERASFRVEDVASEVPIHPQVIEKVLQAFSSPFGAEQDPARLVSDFLRGRNPLNPATLASDGEGNYLVISLAIGTDSLRRMVEVALKGTRHWKAYERIRTEVSERLTTQYLAKSLGTPPMHTNLKYLAPKAGVNYAALGASCPDPSSVGEQTEADGLFVIDDVAICAEVKARSVADSARRGDNARLSRELKATIGSAAQQARRLESLIEQNGGLWLEGGTWLDLSSVQEVRSVVVGLDDYGPAGIVLDELRRAGVIADEKLPWVTSLHDLATVSMVLDRPSELLLYIRRRAASGVSRHFRAVDELDLFMLFLRGGLYVEPDPDLMHRLYPATDPPTARDYRRFAEDNQMTRVATFTDPLDACMYANEGHARPAVKPTFQAHKWAFDLLDFLADGRRPGWFRFGADLLSLSVETQSRLASSVKSIVRRTRTDGRMHSLAQAFAGDWGFVLLVAMTQPKGMPVNEAAVRLETYLKAKRHHVKADRALGILIGENSQVVRVVYRTAPASEDEGLDALLEQMELGRIPAESRPRSPAVQQKPIRRRKKSTKGRRRR
jgi:hypothetical protein